MTARTADGTVLVDDVSFALERGWLVAVVGPTGAGKTSLVRALTGALAIESGSICLGGQDVRDGDETLRRRIGYVAQDDLLHPQLALRRTLDYAASLRLPTHTTATERARRVGAVLAELGLERQADLPVSSLSGGQRKRANVAVELLGQPDVLVLDEPTSGLDPGYEKSVMTTLRELADGGRTVLTVTHSMAALSVCDRVLFLANGGQVAFFGTPDEAATYFNRADAADLFLDLDGAAGSWKDRFRAHPAYAHLVARVGHGVPKAAAEAMPALPGWQAQLHTLVRRYVDLIRADHRHVAMLSLQGPVLGLLLWAVLKPHGLQRIPLPAGVQLSPDAVTVAVFLAISVTWLGTANAVREIVKERRILHREKGTGLSLSAYVSSKIVVLGVLSMVQAIVFAAIACLRQGPLGHGAVLSSGLAEILLATALAGLAATALGLLLSAAVSTPDKAMTALPIMLVAQLVLSGAWVPVANVPGLAQLSDLSGAHWALQALEATVRGDASTWREAMLAMTLLTVGGLVATHFLVVRRFQPAHAPRRQRAALAAAPAVVITPAPRRSGALTPLFAAAASVLVLLGGVTAVGVRFAQTEHPSRTVSATPHQAATPRHPGAVAAATPPRSSAARTTASPPPVAPSQAQVAAVADGSHSAVTARTDRTSATVSATGANSRVATITLPTKVGSLSVPTLPPPLPSLTTPVSVSVPPVSTPVEVTAQAPVTPPTGSAPTSATTTSSQTSTAAALAALRAWQTLAAQAAQAQARQSASNGHR